MASIPSNGYAEVMAGTNNYSGSNSFDGSCPRTAIPPVIGNDLTNKTYVDAATGGGIVGTLTDKGSLITANGTNAVIFDQNPYQTALTTITVYDWNSLAIGQSRNFTTTAPTLIPLGAGITITYSGTDSIKGNVTAVAGTTITITITNFASASYSSTFLLQTAARTSQSLIGLGNTTLAVTPVITTPLPPNIPANSIITQGSANVNSVASLPSLLVNYFITLSGTNVVRGVSNSQVAPAGTGASTILFDGANGGCFFGSTQTPVITVNVSPLSIATGAFLGQEINSVFPDFVGSLSGYTLSYGTGSIVIDDDIALIADALSSTGLAWGVINSASVGAVTSVSGGTSIVMSGTVPAPIVNLNITNSNANATYYPTFVAGVGTQSLLADVSTGVISLNPSNGNFNVVDTLKLTQTNLAVGKNAGLTSQSANAVAIGELAGNNAQGGSAVAIGHNAGRGLTTGQGLSAVAIGHNSARTSQGERSVAIGLNAGDASQDEDAVAIGNAAGQTSQGIYAIAIGYFAGSDTQGANTVAIGIQAGENNQGTSAIAIGAGTGQNTQSSNTVAIGVTAGQTSQGVSAVAIGNTAGFTGQNASAVAIGNATGQNTQGASAVAIGQSAGNFSQGANAVAVGVNAGAGVSGTNFQGASAVAIGNATGQNTQGASAVAIGQNAGNFSQGANAVAIGLNAGAGVSGTNFQGSEAIAIGRTAGQNTQGSRAIAIGYQAGLTTQGTYSIGIGERAGFENQLSNSIAIGRNAGETSQATQNIAIGWDAAKTGQTQDCIAIGIDAGRVNQQTGSVAIGYEAGRNTQGVTSGGKCVAIGYGAGRNSQAANCVAIGNLAGQTATAGSIAINASGVALNPTTASCYIRPIRGVALGLGVGVVFYDAATFELQYSTT
jgi:hypothetical protein